MTDSPETFDNFIHLAVAVVQSASDMIQEIGGLRMRRRQYDYQMRPCDMLDLRKALSDAVRALESYDAIAKTGVQKSTSEEFVAARGGT